MAVSTEQILRSKRKASKAGLYFVNEFDQGYGRRRHGKGFSYIGINGKTLKSERTRKRIESLVIPPAWSQVWICPKSNGHIQARGRDDADRLQYIYHEAWTAISTSTKFDRMSLFAEVLPRIRRRVRHDLNSHGLPRKRVLAAVIRLLDKASLRVGGPDSIKARGATTLQSDDVDLKGHRISLDFPGKSGQRREVEFSDQKVAQVINNCDELDGQFLFEYLTADGRSQHVTSSSVNEYLRNIAKAKITAKDFRTWNGCSVALASLTQNEDHDCSKVREASIRKAVKAAAEKLGNTVAICRKSYIHPNILAAAKSGKLANLLAKVKPLQVRELSQDDVRLKLLLPLLNSA
ncbi:MAG: DNA topoisomerase IB [Planctomycetota bacterium]